MHGDGSSKAGTVADVIRWLLGGRPSLKTITWPPDLFAVAASILQKSGTYPFVVEDWPPGRSKKARLRWMSRVSRAAKQWRQRPDRVPILVAQSILVFLEFRETPLFEIRKNAELCRALLQVCAIADETCAGLGVPDAAPQSRTRRDTLSEKAEELLSPIEESDTTLCLSIHPSKLRVLPKLHTPQSGMTLRSLTHHLALCESGEVEPSWLNLGDPFSSTVDGLNLLVLPWPLKILPSQFTARKQHESRLPCMPDAYGGFFEYKPNSQTPSEFVKTVEEVLADAERVVGHIDGVVLPELAMTEAQRDALRDMLVPRLKFLIGGVAGESPPSNYLVLAFPIAEDTWIELEQHKHHRWQLDRRQIIQYGLGYRLDPVKKWWEQISLGTESLSRRVHFVALRNWLTITGLICEDLARQEPVGDLVRAVGPNLVIALLMDGPQLASRWPGRYATVLADDPGCSVLTVSSSGMVDLCKPPPGASPSRTVAMWKDAQSGEVVHIDLPAGKRGIVLSLTNDWAKEFSADGRSDEGMTGYPILSGVHPV